MPRTVLVHLNVEVDGIDGETADEIGDRIQRELALIATQPLSPLPGYKIVVALAEELEAARYVAEFIPQEWIRDNAHPVDPSGVATWDVTEFFHTLPLETQQHILGYGADYKDVLRTDPNAPEWVREWSGPFDTYIKEIA